MTKLILLREYPTLIEAHLTASRLASGAIESAPDKGHEFRLLDVSSTAGGAWVCAVATTDDVFRELGGRLGLESVEAEASILDALFSLGPKPPAETTSVGMIESTSIADVLRAAQGYSKMGHTVLEIRVKRAGAKGGAHAFFALKAGVATHGAKLPMATLSLEGDYRRYFLPA